jgi:hypothetical protein
VFKKLAVGILVSSIVFLSVNFGSSTYTRNVSGETPESFHLKKGKMSFSGELYDGKVVTKQKVHNICFKDKTYTDCARDEGDVFLKAKEKDSDIEQNLNLENIKSIETMTQANGAKICSTEKDKDVLMFKIKVTFRDGLTKEYLVHPEMALSFVFDNTKADGIVFLYKIDKIENIMETPTSNPTI